MEKLIAVFICTLMLIGILSGLTGCTGHDSPGDGDGGQTSGGTTQTTSPADDETRAVVIVLGATANSKGLNISSPLVQETVYDTIYHYGTVALINADGNPDVVFSQSYDVDKRFKGASPALRRQDALEHTTKLLAVMNTVRADDPEVDYLESLRLAARYLDGLKDDYANKQIIVVGTGVGTTGLLDLRNNILSAQPETVVQMLADREAIPDFQGVHVSWQQLGDVSAPQSPLTQRQINRLTDLYEAMITASNGTFTPDSIIAIPANRDVEYPAVSTVDFPEEAPIVFDPEKTRFDAPVSLSEDLIGFVPDSSQYLYPDKAMETLRPIAQYMLGEGSGANLLLVGSIAGDTDGPKGIQLSQARADAVARTLTELGVASDRLTACGMGCHDPWHISGAGVEGELAKENRKVVLLDANSPQAKSILQEISA